MSIEFFQFACRQDNFGVLIHDTQFLLTACIDTPEERAIMQALEKKNWHLTHIFNTHHHYDHVEANLVLKERFGCQIIGSKKDAGRIPGIDTGVTEDDIYQFGSQTVRFLETPGHTNGHLVIWFPEAKRAFAGDTLFSMGCGRIFEGTAEMMHASLQKIVMLPEDTQIYCGHEYTLDNAGFALTVEPENPALQKRVKDVQRLRKANLPTLPVLLQDEIRTNPFLRTHSVEIRKRLSLEQASDVEVFAQLRAQKDAW